MTDILEAVAKATNHSQALLDQAASATESAKKNLKATRSRERMYRRELLRRANARMSKALRGIAALLEFGRTVQMQELLQFRGEIIIYAVKDSFADGHLFITPDGLGIEVISYRIAWGSNDSIMGRGNEDPGGSIGISFKTLDSLLNAKLVERIASMKVLGVWLDEEDDSDEAQYQRAELRDAQPEEILFQVLVDCADQAKFERYVRAALI